MAWKLAVLPAIVAALIARPDPRAPRPDPARMPIAPMPIARPAVAPAPDVAPSTAPDPVAPSQLGEAKDPPHWEW